jgi:hypothetical protein
MKKTILILIFVSFSQAHATMIADQTLLGASVACTTKGVHTFVKHKGGIQFRLDATEIPNEFILQLWRVLPAVRSGADSLFRNRDGQWTTQVQVSKDESGKCILQSSDSKKLDFSMTIDPTALGEISGTIKGISSSNPGVGQLTCGVSPEYFSKTLSAICKDAPKTAPNSSGLTKGKRSQGKGLRS